MKISDWLFHLFPFLFPNRKRAVKIKFERIIRERWEIVAKRLNAQEIPQPKIILVEPEGASYHEDKVEISYLESLQKDEEITRTVDHELSHHIQRKRNPTFKKHYWFYSCSVLYWLLTGKVRSGLAQKAFVEGFATYIAHLTSGKLSIQTEKAIDLITKGERWKFLFQCSSSLPYALGYAIYSAVASARSEDKAIELGLTASLSDWISASEFLSREQKQ